MGTETTARTLLVYAAKANSAESGSPQWKWYAASTLDTLIRGIGDREMCKEATKMSIALIDGFYRIMDGSVEKPVYFFG